MNYHYDSTLFNTFWYMLKRSIQVAKQSLPDKIINQLLWSSLNIIVFAYVMPHLGLQKDYGASNAIAMAASAAFFTSIQCMYQLLFDISSDGSNIRYELTLPIPQWAVFIKYALEYTLQSCIVSIITAPIGFALIWNQMTISILSLIKFYIMLMVISLFSGFFALFIVSMAKNIAQGLDNVWTRIIFPLWFLGCFQFSWQSLYEVSPAMAYLSLLNPLTYALEGSRASLMFAHNSPNYEYCTIALLFFTFLFGYIGIRRLMHQVDCL